MEEKSKIIHYLFSLEQHLDIYYKTIEDNLICPKWVRKKFMELLKNDIADYIEENPDATMENICAVFGDPFEPNNELLRVLEREYLRKLKKRLVICYGVIVGLLIFSLVLIGIITQQFYGDDYLVHFTNYPVKP